MRLRETSPTVDAVEVVVNRIVTAWKENLVFELKSLFQKAVSITLDWKMRRFTEINLICLSPDLWKRSNDVASIDVSPFELSFQENSFYSFILIYKCNQLL